jgi:DNA-binding NarL/FixJ family response regulator
MKIDFDYFHGNELQIIDLTAKGLSAKEIGVEIGLSTSRISNMRSRILRTLKYKNSSQMSYQYYGYQIRKGQV